MTIHQPSFELASLFDMMVLMGVGGTLAFKGSLDETLEFFREHGGLTYAPMENPLDNILDLLTQNTAKAAELSQALEGTRTRAAECEQIEQLWQRRESIATWSMPPRFRSRWAETLLLARRNLRMWQNRPSIPLAALIKGIYIGVLFAIVFSGRDVETSERSAFTTGIFVLGTLVAIAIASLVCCSIEVRR